MTEGGAELRDLEYQNASLSDECAALRKKVAELEAKLATKESIAGHTPFLYRGDGNGSICTECWKVDQRVVEMRFLCSVCSHFDKDRSSQTHSP
jgi:hypothetical protein